MSVGWNFPSNNYGTLTGIGEAGIETFKSSPFKSLTREICQNSMDARLNQDQPVTVEFSLARIRNSDIPGYTFLKNAVQSCLTFWKEQNNRKTISFFEKAVDTINRDVITILRISDFNTTGLTGSDKEYNTPWQNLVKASGVSDKSGADGGSFGIGKSAPFVCSDLRTVFYATKDINNLEAFQGIARLVSFKKIDLLKKDEDSITTGIGYYGNFDKNSALKQCRSLEKGFVRNNSGTDVYIVGFTEEKSWKDEIITSILENFLISIYYDDLKVIVDGDIISHDTLPDIVEMYKTQSISAYNYYTVLNNKESFFSTYDFEGMGNIEIHLLIQQGFQRKFMMCRKNGMKIFDQKNISGSIPFAGICILKDDSINEYFREMENPEHNAWVSSRHSNKKDAEKKRKLLIKFLRESVLDLAKQSTLDEIDAEGAGEFLPDIMFSQTNSSNNKTETITDISKETIELKAVPSKNSQKGFEKNALGDGENYEFVNGNQTNDVFTGTGSKDHSDGQPNDTHDGNSFGTNFGDGEGSNGYGENKAAAGNATGNETENILRRFNVNIMSVRLFITDIKSKKYSLIFIPKNNYDRGYLELELSGEQGSSAVSVISAVDRDNSKNLICRGNKILLDSITARKYTIEFTIAYDEQSPLEVSLYGYKK